MERRDLLKAMGAATVLALLPHETFAAWSRVGTGLRPVRGLSEAHLALVAGIADTILPRTDTPGASDVGVPAFVDVIVSENYVDADRVAFVAGLDAIDAETRLANPSGFAAMRAEERDAVIERLERLTDRRTEPARTYWRLKGLIVHGYFTSEPVMKTVLKTEIMPGRYDGSAPMPVKAGSAGGSDV
ncbi:MAG: gluconate 2-dehydrogenase subunit 3 family protein [bacterium]